MTDENEPDSTPTPAQSPSAQHKLGLATCPVCQGLHPATRVCIECGGAGRVTLERHGILVGLKPRDDREEEIPPTDPAPVREDDDETR